MEILQARLRLARGVGLLLMLVLSIAGFMLLINILADPVSTAPSDPLAERQTDGEFVQLPGNSSLFSIAVAIVAIIIAIVALVSIARSRPSLSTDPSVSDGSTPISRRARMIPLAAGLVLALLIGGAGLYLAFAESSPLLQAGADQQPGAAGGNTDGHQMYREWIAPIGVIVLAAFFFSVILIGFLKPRLLFVTLGTWLALSLIFGFFSSSSLAGLILFTPVTSAPVPDAFASQVGQHRTVDLPGQSGDDSTRGDPDEIDSDEVSLNNGGVGDTAGETGQSADASEDVLIQNLQSSPDPDVRAEAAAGLADYPSGRSLKALATAGVKDPSLEVRDAALHSITKWSLEDLIEILKNHPDDDIRQAAAAALGRMDDDRAVEPLMEALESDGAASVRAESAKSLGRLDDVAAVTSLVEALRDDVDLRVRENAARALGQLRDQRVASRLIDALGIDAFADVREAAPWALGEAMPQLLQSRGEDTSPSVRAAARAALLRYTINDLIDTLLNDPSAEVRAAAAFLLGERGFSRAIPPLFQALNDTEELVSDAAHKALLEFTEVTQLETGGLVAERSEILYFGGGISASRASRPAHEPVFTVTGAANTSFLRLGVGESFDGARWSQIRSLRLDYPHSTVLAYDVFPEAPFLHLGNSLTEWITVLPEPSASRFGPGLLPVPYLDRSVTTDGTFDTAAGLFIGGNNLFRYGLTSTFPGYPEGQLYTAVPADAAPTLLPENLPQRVVNLARELTANYETPYAKAKAIETHLKENYTYAFAGPDDAPIPDGHDLVDWFLFESREGTCGNFASAFAVLAASIGLPARVVTGWAITPTPDSQIVYTDQAHLIAEVLFEDYGWVQFEPTPGGDGPAGRASASFANDQAEMGELARLRQLAEKAVTTDDPEAWRELEDAGASIHTLENGSRLISLGASTLATPAGTTADQSDDLLKIPVFTVTGAQETGYLVTATGDIYLGDGWRQLDPVALDYGRNGSVPDLVRDSFEDGREPWSNLPASRIEPILLAPDDRDFNNDSSIRIQVSPIGDSGRVPAGVVPVSRHLNRIGLDGSYRPFSGTFEMDDAAMGYQWWSILPRPTAGELNRARAVEDPTYTQLPDDLDERIHDLARRITSGHRTPYAKARAIESHLLNNYAYVLGKDSTKPRRPAGFDVVEWFLFETREGTSGQFSSAFTVLARSVGLPARVVSGWMITPTRGTQIVYSDQSHQWADVAFEGIGWITFEATATGGAPTRTQSDGPPERRSEIIIEAGPTVLATVTNITSWPREIERGRPFNIGGTVRTQGGASVNDMEVEIFVNEIKANGGLRVGSGTVTNGRYQIEIEIPPSMERGRYQLIAHAIGNEEYYESWSDPDIAVFSQSGLVFSGPQEVDVGVEASFQGRVTEDTGAGVSGIPLQILIDGSALPSQRTGNDGSFSFSNTFLQPGNHWAEVRFSENNYLRANSARIDLEVVVPTELSLDVQPQVLVGRTFTIGGRLLDSRDQPLGGRPVGISVDGGDIIRTTAGADGRFQVEHTLETSGEFTIEATFTEDRPVLGSRASASIVVLNESVLTFEGPLEVLAGDTVSFFGSVSSPTLDEPGPLEVEILGAEGAGVQTITTQPDGTFSYESPPMPETGPRSLTARLAEQATLTASAASVSFSVVHGTILQVDGPAIATFGGEVVMTGSLRRSDGQPIAEAPVQVGTEAVLTGDDGTFSYTIPIPSSLGSGAIEERVGIQYSYAGTEHLASAEGSRSIVIGVPRLTADRLAPVTRGDIAEIRGAAFTGTRPMPDASVSLPSGLQDTTGATGEFLISYPVPPDASLGPRTFTMTLDGLGVDIPITLDIRSATHVVATALDDIRPGRAAIVQAALYDDSGAGIPNAPLRTSTGLTLTTDEFGIAQFEVAVPDSETLLALPITFTYSGNNANMPLNYFLALPVTPPSFNWVLFVGLPVLLLALTGLAFSAYRLRLAGVPVTVLNPRRPLPSWGAQVVTVRAPVQRELDSEDEGQSLEPLETRITIELGGSAVETPGVYGITEEIVIIGRLYDEDDAPVTGTTIELSVADREPVELVTDGNGEFRHLLTADDFGEFTLSMHFAGTPDYVGSEAYASFRIVDFRAEMVRLFGAFVEWASQLDVGISGQSPREIESILVAAGIPVDQRALDEVVTRFEEADYSEHDIARRHYEAMYKAWQIVIGE